MWHAAVTPPSVPDLQESHVGKVFRTSNNDPFDNKFIKVLDVSKGMNGVVYVQYMYMQDSTTEYAHGATKHSDSYATFAFTFDKY